MVQLFSCLMEANRNGIYMKVDTKIGKWHNCTARVDEGLQEGYTAGEEQHRAEPSSGVSLNELSYKV